MNSKHSHDEQAFEDAVVVFVVLVMLGTAIFYLWMMTTYYEHWYLVTISYKIFIFAPCGLLVAGATYIIFRK